MSLIQLDKVTVLSLGRGDVSLTPQYGALIVSNLKHPKEIDSACTNGDEADGKLLISFGTSFSVRQMIDMLKLIAEEMEEV